VFSDKTDVLSACSYRPVLAACRVPSADRELRRVQGSALRSRRCRKGSGAVSAVRVRGWGRRTGGTQGGRPDHTRRPIGCPPLADVPGGCGEPAGGSKRTPASGLRPRSHILVLVEIVAPPRAARALGVSQAPDHWRSTIQWRGQHSKHYRPVQAGRKAAHQGLGGAGRGTTQFQRLGVSGMNISRISSTEEGPQLTRALGALRKGSSLV
jgi:hypothetical protein